MIGKRWWWKKRGVKGVLKSLRDGLDGRRAIWKREKFEIKNNRQCPYTWWCHKLVFDLKNGLIVLDIFHDRYYHTAYHINLWGLEKMRETLLRFLRLKTICNGTFSPNDALMDLPWPFGSIELMMVRRKWMTNRYIFCEVLDYELNTAVYELSGPWTLLE